jgi:hypothetical protein
MSLRGVLLLFVAGGLFTGCGNGLSRPSAGMFDLPLPADLPRTTAVTVVSTQDGATVSAAVAPVNTAINSTALDYLPNPAGAGLEQFAYALYEFNTPDFAGAAKVTPNWSDNPGEAWIGVADFTENRYQWLGVNAADPNAALTFGNWGTPVAPVSGNVFVLVLVAGSDAATLEQLTIGEVGSPVNTPPIAHINYAAYSQFSPRRDWAGVGEELYFTTDASFDPDGYLTAINLDWDSNGTYDKFYIPNALNDPADITHFWDTPGVKTVTLRVTDNKGATATDTVKVRIVRGPPFDEVEPNDDAASAQELQLPYIPEFWGHFSVDANAVDWFKIAVPANDTWVEAALNVVGCEGINCHPQIELYDAGLNLIDTDFERLTLKLDAGDYYFKLLEQDQIEEHFYELQVIGLSTLESASLAVTPASSDQPWLLELNALGGATGEFITPASVRWFVNGFEVDGNALVPLANETNVVLPLFDAEPVEIGVEVTDQEGTITTDEEIVVPQGTFEPTGHDVASAPNWPLEPDGEDYFLPSLHGAVTQLNSNYYCIQIPKNGTLTIWLNRSPYMESPLTVYDAALQEQGALSPTTTKASVTLTVTTGNYYVRIEPSLNGVSPAPYMLVGFFKPDGGSS